MRFDVISVFPEWVASVTRCGVTGRARERGLMSLQCWDPRCFTEDRHRTVDDRPYGGGPGMVMKVEPLRRAIGAARGADPRPAKVLYMSPQGRRLDQAAVHDMAGQSRLILLAGRYEGIDERLIQLEVDEEWSIGDYVLSGGELAAMVLMDACARLLPGALGDEDSAAQDSFSTGLLDCPHYTRPEMIDGLEVPPVLRSGDHGRIERWRRKQALGRTWMRRPDILAQQELSQADRRLLEEYQREHAEGQAAPSSD
ncbi:MULTISPECIES: tRNA (guanosine(37)-N1)-methyltransferase TrmD [Ectothiorhodospira]|uniref:tRNA (guanine-N(1)-)-methyltransferase n=1 Tax=Ectothiorhodospira marina TaxID=1396821 RepID=A0A1H7NM45_9GAMM|nr:MULTISPECIES: tRNA (guanosine(37)-N1)-methyltransferase TrmD [Ectothiorhodospira]MCG5516320.1 tRNA (guanosine(37)-N1)-methyltransferase TrmD [Ectothiorhodospira sp. 9100]MCG5519301.1 tRNA (guanosine(37)-N1)-methyltransferase TrmD [Ectothiorhodospira sp. 9905]SEL24623.1 tRNA (guanine37-N1)-methyltransferase [Ectothiorhodospira marina]